jgi:hypothetical protein
MVAHILLPSKLKGPPWRELNSTVPNDFLTGSLPSGGEVKMEARLEYFRMRVQSFYGRLLGAESQIRRGYSSAWQLLCVTG